MSQQKSPVWIVADVENGRLAPVSLQLMGCARRLADQLETAAEALLLDREPGAMPRELVAAGADRVYVGSDPNLRHYHPEIHPALIADLAAAHAPQILLIGGTPVGRELAPLVAARLSTGLTAHCIDLCMNAEGVLEQKIPAYGGEITIICPEKRPQMATVAQGVFPLPTPDPDRSGELVDISGPFPAPRQVTVLEVVTREPEGVCLENAPVVVAGGAGVGGPDGWREVAALSTLLNAALGCTRPAVDEGWSELERMIGQSGKMTGPEVYIGIGLSGEQQHMVGIAGAKLMIAVNNDKKSPVFTQVDIGIVDDCRSFVPVLIDAIRQYQKSKGSASCP